MVNPANSLSQGLQFQQMTAKFHGGRKKNKKSKMVTRRNRMRGGGMFTPYSDYPSAMSQTLPTDIRELARVASLDAKFAELPAIERAAGVPQSGGRRHRGGQSPVNAPTMLLSSPAEEAAARLNPQWYTENTVVPAFRGPLPVPGSQPVPAPAPPATPAPPAKGGKRNKRKTKRARNLMKETRNNNNNNNRNSNGENKERVRLLAEELKAAKNNGGERNHNACFPKIAGSRR